MQPKTPYLIQRGSFKPYEGYPRISDAIRLDYMGSAEFEFGALPESLCALEATKNTLTIITVSEINIPKKGSSKTIPLKVLSPWPEGSAEWQQYKKYLLNMRDGKVRLKENSGFAEETLNRYNRCDFWWDIENHVMWSFRQHFAHDILHLLQSSWDYMNEAASKRIS